MKNINFNSIKEGTREGATSFVMVMFFSMLLGIIMVGFISIMLSNIMSSTNYDLSQSAYDSSLAGVEDAKIMLLKFNNCVIHSNASNVSNCDRITRVLTNNDAGEDCNIVGKALGRISENDNGIYETPIQSTYVSGDNSAKNFSNSLDQAYTCVKVDTDVDEYLGTISKDSDFKVIPIRTSFSVKGNSGQDTPSPVKYIEISWFNKTDYEKATGKNSIRTSFRNMGDVANGFLNKRTGNNVKNSFTKDSTYSPSIQLGLIQSAVGGFTIKSFETSKDSSTNRGMLLLRPYEQGSTMGKTVIRNGINTGFAGSAISGSEDWGANLNAVNSPVEVHCGNTVEGPTGVFSNNEYACSAIIELPTAISANSNGRLSSGAAASDNMRYLTLTTPYEGIDTSFSIKMYGNSDGNCYFDDAGNPNNCEVKQFAGVQTRVDSTGRANDLFRRVEARVLLIDVNYPFPKYALSAYCEGDNCQAGEGQVKKNYWVSYNCFTLINGDNKGCGGGDLNNNQNFTESATPGF